MTAAREGDRMEVRSRLDRCSRRRLAFVSVLATVDARLAARSQLTKSVVIR
jgi:3-hydroxymyristoyl/3-hydroxydecanoyl-(acyl carrier protein) dehydratase